MTDGPFKNLKLDRRSKRFAEAVQNDAVDLKTRCAYANDAILHGILNENQQLLLDLQSYGQDTQRNLDPKGAIEIIFDTHPKSEFADQLHREIRLRLHDGEPSENAINNGLGAALETNIGEFRTRTQEACFEAYSNGEMRKDRLDRFIRGSDQALQHVDRQRIMDALRHGDKNAFKQDVRKKTGLDEGPKM